MKVPQLLRWRLNWLGSNAPEWKLFRSPWARHRAAQRVIMERGWLGLFAAVLIACVLPVTALMASVGALGSMTIALIVGYSITIPLAFMLLRRQMRRSLRREHGKTRLTCCWECGKILSRQERPYHTCDDQHTLTLRRSA